MPCEHVYEVDPDDRRFKVCIRCKDVQWRTDEEIVEELKEIANDNEVT